VWAGAFDLCPWLCQCQVAICQRLGDGLMMGQSLLCRAFIMSRGSVVCDVTPARTRADDAGCAVTTLASRRQEWLVNHLNERDMIPNLKQRRLRCIAPVKQHRLAHPPPRPTLALISSVQSNTHRCCRRSLRR
jgi:hypothetical protein